MTPFSAAHSRTALVSPLAGALSLIVGTLVLLGWSIDSPILKSLVPSFITMKPNAAIAFMLCGLALLFIRENVRTTNRVAAGCALVVAAIGGLTILEYLLEWPQGFDEWLFQDETDRSVTAFPGRMGFNTAWCFVLFGTALLANRGTGEWHLSLGEGPALGGLFTAFIALLGYLYQAQSLYGIGRYTPMALHTTLTLLVVGAGILFLHTDRGLMAIMTSEQPGGQMLRRLLPSMLLVIPVAGWLRLIGEQHGLYDTELGLAIFATLTIVTIACLLAWTAHSLNFAANAHDLARHGRDESDRRFRQLAESIREVFWLSDPEKNQILYISPGYETVWGRTCDSLYASPRSWAEAIHPDDRDRVWLAATMKQTTGTYDEEYRIVRPDGSIRWIHDRAFPICNDKGQIFRIAGVADDITTHRQTELALRESEERFEKAFRSSPHPLGITELETGICVDANDACLALFGFSREEVIGHSTLELHIWACPEDRARVVQYLREHGSLKNKEITLQTKQGKPRQFLFSSELIELNGVLCVVTVGNDITERKRMEQALKLTQLCVDSTEDSVFFTRSDARFAYANNAACRRLGYSREELTNMSVYDIDPDYQPDKWPTHWEELRMRKSLTIETHHRTKDGRIVPIEMSITHTSFDGEEYACAIARDITDRKCAEEALRKVHDELERRVLERTAELSESRQRLEVILDGTAIATWDWEIQTGNVTYNEQWALNRGLRLEDVAPHVSSWTDGIHPEDRPRVERTLNDYLAGRTDTHECEMRIKTSAGEWTWIMDRGRVIEKADDGSPLRMVGIELDITERKRGEHELKRTQAFISSVVENIPNMVFVKDAKDLRFVQFNKAGEELLGYRREELLGKSDYDFFPREEADFFTQKDREVLESGRLLDIPSEPIKTKHHGMRILHTKKIPLLDETGQPRYLLGLSEDITERTRVEEELRLTQFAMDQAADAILWADSDKRFVYVNDAACRSLGYSRDELLALSIPDISVHHDPETFQARVDQLRGVGFEQYESSHRAKDGSIIPIEVVVTLLQRDGKEYTCAVARDITERKEAEAALQSAYRQVRNLANRLESAKELERQRIARELHDEFGQALTGLKFDVAWIRSKLMRVRQTPAGSGLIKKTDAMSGAVDALIDAVRETATSLRPSMLDDLGLIPALDWFVKQFRSHTDIDCTFEADAEVERVALTANASTALFRLAQEMLTNVARHAKATSARLHLSRSADSLLLECTDDGGGIPAHRISRSTSLGLRGMEERAALLGGSFTIAGSPGVGTTATVSLPLSSVRIPTMENQP